MAPAHGEVDELVLVDHDVALLLDRLGRNASKVARVIHDPSRYFG